MENFKAFENFLDPVLKNLDPSLFQNVVLGVLAVFIPFGIVFFTDILGSKKPRSDFEKMVLTEEVFDVKRLFGVSVLCIAVLSFFANVENDMSVSRKLLAILIISISIWQFWKSFKKVLRFSEGYKSEFEISFMRNLQLSTVMGVDNTKTEEMMTKAWESFLSEETRENEGEFMKIFTKHIDDAIKSEKFVLVIDLSRSYQKNLQNRNRFFIDNQMPPKVFEWVEIFWKQRSKKDKDDVLWWDYFLVEFFPEIVKLLLLDSHGTYCLFKEFEKHIKSKEEELNKYKKDGNTQQAEDCWYYIKSLFNVFFKVFLENINSMRNSNVDFKQRFPQDWKITADNSRKYIPRIVLDEFLDWLSFNNLNDLENNRQLIKTLFPETDLRLFSIFLPLFLCQKNIKSAIEQKSPSLIDDSPVFSVRRNEDYKKLFEQHRQRREREVINIIFKFFVTRWFPLCWEETDFAEEELSNWQKYSEEQKSRIIARICKSKLQKMLDEFDSSEIKDFCAKTNEEVYERKRRGFVKLLSLLVNSVSPSHFGQDA